MQPTDSPITTAARLAGGTASGSVDGSGGPRLIASRRASHRAAPNA